MRWLLLLGLLLPSLQAAVDGVVMNLTTGKPQPGARVTLYSVSQQGRKPVQTVKAGPGGKFVIQEAASGTRLLQVVYEGVAYNRMLQPGATTSGLRLGVYESSRDRSRTKVTEDMILLEPMGGILHVNETVLYMNPTKVTFADPKNGTLRVFIPAGIRGEPRVMVTAPKGMPVERPPVKTKSKGVYKIDFPLKPGETRFDITYILPKPESGILKGRILHRGGPVRLVAPQGVTLSGEGVTLLGREPKTHAGVYALAKRNYIVRVQGSGSLRAPAPKQPSGGSGIEQIRARIYDRAGVLVGLSLVILMLGFVLLYRRGEPGTAAAKVSSGKGKRH